MFAKKQNHLLQKRICAGEITLIVTDDEEGWKNAMKHASRGKVAWKAWKMAEQPKMAPNNLNGSMEATKE